VLGLGLVILLIRLCLLLQLSIFTTKCSACPYVRLGLEAARIELYAGFFILREPSLVMVNSLMKGVINCLN